MRRKRFVPWYTRTPARLRRIELEALEDRTQPATLSLLLADPSVLEGGPATSATVSRDGDLSQPLTVLLQSSNPTDVSVPASVVIPAGSALAVFDVTPADNGDIDGNRPVTITASAVTGPLTVGLDPAFGSAGVSEIPHGAGTSIWPGDVIVLADGRSVAVGGSGMFQNGWAVTLLQPDGTPDPSFGPDGTGTVHTIFANTSGAAVAYGVAVQPDGKLVVVGTVNSNLYTRWGIARYHPDGSLDSTFDADGMQVIEFTGHSSADDVHLLPDDTIVVTGTGYNGFHVAWIQPNGHVSGSRTIHFDTGYPEYAAAYASAVAPDGSLVLAGRVYNQGSFAVARLTPLADGGWFDETFGPGGVRLIPASAFGASYSDAEAHAVEVLPDGKVLLGGTVWTRDPIDNSIRGDMAAARLNADGTLDPGFGGDGTVTVDLLDPTYGEVGDDGAYALAVQPNGKIVLGGHASRVGNGSNQALARLNADGTPDTTFNGSGFHVAAEHPILGSFESIHAIALQLDGKLVAQAGGQDGNYFNRQWVARFDMATGESLSASADVTVQDDETPQPQLTLTVSPADFGEADGASAAIGTVTRLHLPLDEALIVTLVSSDPGEAGVPVSVTIPAEEVSATFAIASVDDAVHDGEQTVQISAAAAGLAASAEVRVSDDEPAVPTLTVTVDPSGVLEHAGANVVTGTVTRANVPLDTALTVTLSSSDPGEAIVPATVVIPAGQTSTSFLISAVDDTLLDGTQAVTITASATVPVGGTSGPISYDTSWGNSGWVSGYVRGRLAVQADGKLLVAGTSGSVGSSADFGISRYFPDGSVDYTFGSSGRVTTNILGASDQPTAILVQPDGKIVVAGIGNAAGQPVSFVVVRYHANGTLDSTFGSGGTVVLSFGQSANLADAALQPDGKIVLAGNIGGNFGLARLTADGALDADFGGGWLTATFSSGSRANAVAVMADGRIVVAGVTGEGSATSRIAVSRYLASGTPDDSFGPGGIREIDLAGAFEMATDLLVQPDGKVVIAAPLRANDTTTNNDFAIVRLNSDGTLDGGFGSGGVVVEAAASSSSAAPVRIYLQPDGRIVAAGTSGQQQSSTLRGRMLRLSTNGTVETRADSAWTSSTTEAITQDAAGNLYLAYNYGSGSSGYVDRYRTAGTTISGEVGLAVLDNEPFAAANDAYSLGEDGVLTVSTAGGVRANDTVTATIDVGAERVSGPASGTLTLNADGSFTYTPAANFSGTDSFTYRLRDGAAVSNTATVTLTVTGVNDAPLAVQDAYTTAEDTPLTVTAVAGQTALTMVSDAGDWIGQGRSYNLSPSTGNFSVTGNVNYLTVRYQNPTNSSDYWSLTFRSPYNDVPLTVGTYLNAERAAFRTLGKPGLDVTGQHRGSNTLTGQFTILQIETGASGQVVRFAADFEQHSEGGTPALRGSVRFNYAPGAGAGVLANDADVERDPLQAILVDGPAHGQVALNPNGTFTYTPAANYSGSDSFTYKVSDGSAESNVATVNLTVTAVNDPPTGVHDTATTAEETAVVLDVVANDLDAEGDPLLPVLLTQPQFGTVVVQNGRLVYTPAAHFFGTDSFSYRPTDRAGAVTGSPATVTVTVTPVDDRPVAEADAYTTDQGVALTVAAPGVLANDSEFDGDALTALVMTGPSHGAVTIHPDGSFTYTPDPAFFGTDSFTYAASDGVGTPVEATVTLTVLRANQPPTANADAVATTEDILLVLEQAVLLGNDTDPEGDLLTVVISSQPTNGSVEVSPNDGKIYYRPLANFNGSDSFTYRAFDGRDHSAPVTVTISVAAVNDAPTTRADFYTVNEDGSLTADGMGVLGNDSDPERSPLTALLVSGTTRGALSFNPNGSFTYTPGANYYGQDSFTYRASDGEVLSTPVTVTINVTAVNDVPVANPDAVTATEDVQLMIAHASLLANDSDLDGSPPGSNINGLRAVLVSGPANGTLTSAVTTGSAWIYRGNANFHGSDSFTYRAWDGAGYSAPVTVTVTVLPVNDAPVGGADAYTLDEDTPLTVAGPGVLGNDSDAEGNALSATLVNSPTNGTLALDPDGGFTYTPRANYAGSDSFTYRPGDGQLQGSAITVTLTIRAVNDAPVANADSYTVAEDGTLSVVTGGSTLDQQSLKDGYNFNAGITSTHWQQTVRAGSAGILSSFDLFLSADSSQTASFDVFVNKGEGWQTDAPEFVTRVTVTTAMKNQWLTIDVSAANIQLAAGEWYTIGARNGGSYSVSAYLVGSDEGHVGDSYPGGRLWYNGSPLNGGGGAGYDLKFRTRMLPVSQAGLLANDSDADGNPLTALVVTGPVNGSLSLNPNGSFVYTPNANFTGSDSFTYRASDGSADSAAATVSITVTPVNDIPVSADDAFSTAEDTPLSGSVLGNDSDIDGDSLSVVAVGALPDGLTLYADGSFSYSPPMNFHGAVSFQYRVNDGTIDSAVATATITVSAVNDLPTTGGLPAVVLPEDAAATPVVLTGGFADVEDGAAGLIYAVVGNSNLGLFSTMSLAGGTLTLRPAANASGSAVLTVRATDAGGASVQTMLAVTVTAVNDAPSFTRGANQTVSAGAGPQSVAGWATNLSRGPADEAAQTLSFEVSTSNPGLFVALPAIDPATGTLTFIPEAGVTGTATVSVSLRDNGGTDNGGTDTSATQTFSITVGPTGLPTTSGARMVGSELVITGADGADTVKVSPQSGKIKVDATLNGKQFSQTFSSVTRVRVDVRGGNDSVTFASNLTVPTWTDAGAGNDTVTGGGGTDQIYLGAGDDTANGGAGNDFVAGGAGRDLIQGGSGNDQLYGGADNDLLAGESGADAVFGQLGHDLLFGGTAAVRDTRRDSLSKVLTDWNPASASSYTNLRGRLTVSDDGVADSLLGESGTDWFWIHALDLITDLESGEQTN